MAETTVPNGPIVIVPFGNWEKFPKALDAFFADYNEYVQHIRDFSCYHVVDGWVDLHDLFKLGTVPSDWRITVRKSKMDFSDAKRLSDLPGIFRQRAQMCIFAAAITEDDKEILMGYGYQKVINLSTTQLADPLSLFHSVFHQVFDLQPLA